MKLKQYLVRNFKCVLDSGDIDVGDRITCFVGKNESGKTALLEALRNTNPALDRRGRNVYDKQRDLPKHKYSENCEAVYVECYYELDDEDVQKVEELLGKGVLKGTRFKVEQDQNNTVRLLPDDIKANMQVAMNNLVTNIDLTVDQKEKVKNAKTWDDFINVLNDVGETPETQRAINVAHQVISCDRSLVQYILDEVIKPLLPVFFYLDEYPQIEGSVNVNTLATRERENTLTDPDRMMIRLLEAAKMYFRQMEGANSQNALANIYGRSEGLTKASEHVTAKILKYWPQKEHLQIRLEPRIAAAGDPEGMQAGVNIWIEIYDKNKKESVPLDQRSKGFIWSLSLLINCASIEQQHKNIIFLLDEPGLHLHGDAQADLLRFFEEEFTNTQIVYTTHSPFMVDASKPERIRVVNNSGEGTKVSSEALSLKNGRLLPLQAALGYGITQSLFIAPDCIVVEGTSDRFFLQKISEKLISEGCIGLSPRWIIAPACGVGRVASFIGFIVPQQDINVVALLDSQKERKGDIDFLRDAALLGERRVITYAEFLARDEADVEDLFEPSFYLKIFNETYDEYLISHITVDDLGEGSGRIVKKIEGYLKKPNNKLKQKPLKLGKGGYIHHDPAFYFHLNIDTLWAEISDDTRNIFETIFKHINELLK